MKQLYQMYLQTKLPSFQSASPQVCLHRRVLPSSYFSYPSPLISTATSGLNLIVSHPTNFNSDNYVKYFLTKYFLPNIFQHIHFLTPIPNTGINQTGNGLSSPSQSHAFKVFKAGRG